MAPLKWISEVAQIGIVTNYGEPSYEDDDSSKRKHNLKMTWIVPTRKLYHEWRGRPSSIWFPISGWNVLMNNGGGEPFGNGDNNVPRGIGSCPLGGGGSGPLGGGGNNPLQGNDNDLLRGGGNGLSGGGGNNLIGGVSSGPLIDQNPRSYGVGPIGPWIGPIWNLWYPLWYPV